MNIQINNVVHVQCDCSQQRRMSHEQSGEWGAIALAALECLCKLVVLLVVTVGAVVWWLTCRAAHGVVAIEQQYGSGGDVLRALGPGHRVNELETTEMTRYVDKTV